MKRALSFLISLILIITSIVYPKNDVCAAIGDITTQYGSIINDFDYSVINSLDNYNTLFEKNYSNNNLPYSVDLSESIYMPPVFRQGNIGQCTAVSQVYYQFSYEWNKKHNIEATYENSFAPLFNYNLAMNNSNGSNEKKVYETELYKGCIPNYIQADYEWVGESWMPEANVWNEADNYRIKDVFEIKNSFNGSISGPRDSKLDTFKAALVDGHLITFYIFQTMGGFNYGNYMYISDDNYPSNSEYDGDIIRVRLFDNYYGVTLGNHRATIVGYNDNIWVDINEDGLVQDSEKGAFKVVDSSGTGFFNDGYYWLSYSALTKFYQYGVDGMTEQSANDYYYVFDIVAVDDYDSDSNIKMVIDYSTPGRNYYAIKLSATEVSYDQAGNVILGDTYSSVLPYRKYGPSNNQNNQTISFGLSLPEFSSYQSGEITFDLDRVVEDITWSDIDNYIWKVEIIPEISVFTTTMYESKINSIYIKDFADNSNQPIQCTYKLPISLKSSDRFEASFNYDMDYYNLSYEDEITYINEDTGIEEDDIQVGDTIRPISPIKNTGDTPVFRESVINTLYELDGELRWTDAYKLSSKLAPNSSILVESDSADEIETTDYKINDDGTITFYNAGSYEIKSWINYDNSLPNEIGGNIDENNHSQTTITVTDNSSAIRIDSFTSTDDTVEVNDYIDFTTTLRDSTNKQMKLIVEKDEVVVYEGSYQTNLTQRYTFTSGGNYKVKAVITNGTESQNTETIYVNVIDPGTMSDLRVTNLQFKDSVTNTINERVYVGETMRFDADVKNVGLASTPADKLMRLGFYVTELEDEDDEADVSQLTDDDLIQICDTFHNNNGLSPGASTRLVSSLQDGTYSFDEPGIYVVTAWINDDGNIEGEYGGNTAANNYCQMTIEVLSQYDFTEGITTLSSNAVYRGDSVTIRVSNLNFLPASNNYTRLNVYDSQMNPVYQGDYGSGLSKSYTFTDSGTYYMQLDIKEKYSGKRGLSELKEVTVAQTSGYDLSVTGISYYNNTTESIGGTIRTNDEINLKATVKNIGLSDVPDNSNVKIKYTVSNENDIILYSSNVEEDGIEAGEEKVYTSQSGGAENDGTVSFSESGEYTVRAYVNYDNTLTNETFGYEYSNNIYETTITVSDRDEFMAQNLLVYDELAEDYISSNKTVNIGDTVKFKGEYLVGGDVIPGTSIVYKGIIGSCITVYDSLGEIYYQDIPKGNKYHECKFNDDGVYTAELCMVARNETEIYYTGITKTITVTRQSGYDFSVEDITYENIETGIEGGDVKPGDKLRIIADIKNVGDTDSPSDMSIPVTYFVSNCQTVYGASDPIDSMDTVSVTSQRGDYLGGVVSFKEEGDYTVDVYVNTYNTCYGEIGGPLSKNNRAKVTIHVETPQKRVNVTGFKLNNVSSDLSANINDNVTFKVESLNVIMPMVKLEAYGDNGVTFVTDLAYGKQLTRSFTVPGNYYVRMKLLDLATNEEVTTGFRKVTVSSIQS